MLARVSLAAGLALALFAVAVLLDGTLCPFANLTGHPCPGCGMTRAALRLMQGDLIGALRLHPLSPLCVPLVVVVVLEGVLSAGRAGRIGWSEHLLTRWRLHPDWIFGALSLMLLGVWIARFFGAFGGPVSID